MGVLAACASLSLAALALLTGAEAKETLSPFDCAKVKLSSVQSFDLSRIPFPVSTSNIESTPPSETRTTIDIDLCKPLAANPDRSEADQCPRGTRICITIESIKDDRTTVIQAIPVAYSGDGGGSRIQAVAEFGDSLDGGERAIKLELPGADYAGRKQKTKLELVCDKAAAQDAKPTARKYDRADGQLEIRWPTRFACSSDGGSGGGSNPPPSQTDPGSGGEIGSDTDTGGGGFFSWLFFLLFLGLAIYMGLGMYNNYNQYGATGWDLVPHRDFWRESPYIAKDAASHVWRSVAGGSSSGGGFGGAGGRGAYEPL